MANEITRPSGLFLKQTLPLAVLVSGAMALENGLPASSVFRDLAEAGGLMSYSMDVDDGFYRAAYFVDRLLKGAKPANLPSSSRPSSNW